MFHTRKNTDRKKYLGKLKTSVRSNCDELRRRLVNCPIKTLKKVAKMKFPENTTIEIDGESIGVNEASTRSVEYYSELVTLAKPTSYNDILKEFIHINDESEIQTKYQECVEKISERCEESKNKLRFILQSIRGITKVLKENKKGD